MVHVRPRPNLASGNDHEVSNRRTRYDNQYDESFNAVLKGLEIERPMSQPPVASKRGNSFWAVMTVLRVSMFYITVIENYERIKCYVNNANILCLIIVTLVMN